LGKHVNFRADTINGEIQEFPPTFELDCSRVHAIGESIVRDYDDNFNIVAKKVFLVSYGKQTFGSSQFKTLDEFNDYLGVSCRCCPCVECFPFINGCIIELNGCEVQMCGCEYHDALINNCQILMNGCNVRLN
jgi:hypothetical protein